MESAADDVVFEQPLNERVRSLLRLEFLFNQYAHHRSQSALWSTRSALHTLLDILSVIGRSDLKTELLKDLSDQYGHLSSLNARPEIDPPRLQAVLDELRQAVNRLQATVTHYPAAILRESDLLRSVLNRFAIPGGTCGFDLPAYHRWLSRPHPQILTDLDRWYGQLDALEAGIRVYLKLLRQSTHATTQRTEHGIFLYTPQMHYQLIRVTIPADLDVYPEISASRHRFSIRFMRLGDVNARNPQETTSVPFRLQCCTLNLPA